MAAFHAGVSAGEGEQFTVSKVANSLFSKGHGLQDLPSLPIKVAHTELLLGSGALQPWRMCLPACAVPAAARSPGSRLLQVPSRSSQASCCPHLTRVKWLCCARWGREELCRGTSPQDAPWDWLPLESHHYLLLWAGSCRSGCSAGMAIAALCAHIAGDSYSCSLEEQRVGGRQDQPLKLPIQFVSKLSIPFSTDATGSVFDLMGL